MTTTRSYVNNKMQPVSNTVSILTDTLLSNPLGRLALGSVEMSVSTVHNCIDFLLPPGADEDTAARKHILLCVTWAVYNLWHFFF